jgi:hypothetical protein
VNGNAPNSSQIDPDKAAAHEFLSELSTRIATQPLPYQYGVEARALESLWEIFGQARAAIKKYPGCKVFAEAVTKMLNEELRPVTAKWHRAHDEGILNSRDGADAFRADLAEVQSKLKKFEGELQELAYGSKFLDISVPLVLPEAELNKCLKDLVFGLRKCPPIPDKIIDAINLSEAEEVKERRTLRAHAAPDSNINAVGLAFSGGGIRSATFCLGVNQVLAARGLLKDVDFLSTVSGGGYTGSFLTARLGNKENYADVAGPYGPDPEPIKYLRNRAKYLTAVDLKDKWSMVTATLAGMILNWSAPILMVAVAALITSRLDNSSGGPWWPILLAGAGLLSVAALVRYGVLMRKGSKAARRGGEQLGWLFAITVLLAASWLIVLGYRVIPAWIAWIPSHWAISGSLGGLAVAGPAILRFVPVLKTPAVRKVALQALLWLAGLIIPIGALGLFYAFWLLADLYSAVILVVIAIVLAIVAVAVLNINLTAPHRLYRDRLAATFIQKEMGGDETIPLTGINPEKSAPYHLINAALNLPSSKNPIMRDRKCDFFLFSKHWCGSPLVGYHATASWKTNNSPADLATAMAVSGAAVSSYMGLGSMPSLTALLIFLNIRLGFWIWNPVHEVSSQGAEVRSRVWMRSPGLKEQYRTPGFTCLAREMTGIQMSEDKGWLNLSDGGHIENMAVYELLRRRCKYIICVDGESDPEYTFHGLMTLARHAQIDFGVRIESSLGELKPDPKTNFSRVHAVLCRVHYPEGDVDRPTAIGLLLYLKLSMTGNEPELIKRYRINHPDFPHQTTLDQFFDEEQFEAYRQLGVHIADGLFKPALMSGNTAPTTIAQWFRQLGENLLTP